MQQVYELPGDTPPHIMEKQTEIVLSKSPLERLKMCTDMIEFSLEMVKRLIINDNPDITPGRLKFEMIKMIYADCYDEEEMARIELHFTGASQTEFSQIS